MLPGAKKQARVRAGSALDPHRTTPVIRPCGPAREGRQVQPMAETDVDLGRRQCRPRFAMPATEWYQ
jgi:hypothetical protein